MSGSGTAAIQWPDAICIPVAAARLLRFIPANHTGSQFVTHPPQHRPYVTIVSTSISPSPDHEAAGGDSPVSDSSATDKLARRDRIVKRWVTLLAALILIGVLFLIIRVQGYVRGVEFAPSHFQQRRFSFYEIPLIHVQITPIRRAADTPATANYLRVNSLVQTLRGQPTNWHLVSITRGLTAVTPADAQFLVTQLNLASGGDEYWRTWSIDHPQHAKVLWPIVQDLALRELYILLPPLFEIAQIEQTPSELQANLQARLRKDFATLVRDLRSTQRDQLAELILDEAIADFPDDENLVKLRAPNAD